MISAPSGVVVLCDANVLYKSLLRDLLMWLGDRQAIQPRWTERIHDEWMGNLLKKRPELNRAALERTRLLMDKTIPQATVSVTTRGGSYHLPDPDDQHVLGAAIAAGAKYILTFNLPDFPVSALSTYKLLAVHPDTFLQSCLEQQQTAVLNVLHELRANLKNPPFTPDDLLTAVLRAELLGFAGQLQPLKDRISARTETLCFFCQML